MVYSHEVFEANLACICCFPHATHPSQFKYPESPLQCCNYTLLTKERMPYVGWAMSLYLWPSPVPEVLDISLKFDIQNFH